MTTSIHSSTTASQLDENPSVARSNRAKRINPVRVLLFATILILAVYVAYQRISTTANADTITYVQNYAGGFAAVGMTDRQPGFIILSALDRPKVDYSADTVHSGLAGSHTLLHIKTPQTPWQTRLRGPQVIMIGSTGGVSNVPVDWSHADFTQFLDGLDCAKADAKGGAHQCGHPFVDLDNLLSQRNPADVPAEIRAFLKPYVRAVQHPAK